MIERIQIAKQTFNEKQQLENGQYVGNLPLQDTKELESLLSMALCWCKKLFLAQQSRWLS